MIRFTSLSFLLFTLKLISLSQNWSEIGYGTNTLDANNIIKTIVIDSNNHVYAAGSFSNADSYKYVAKLNGNIWSELGSGGSSLKANGDIISLFINKKNSTILAGGDFKNTNNEIYVSQWVYNRTWLEIPSVLIPPKEGERIQEISSLFANKNGDIYVGGGYGNNILFPFINLLTNSKWESFKGRFVGNSVPGDYEGDCPIVIIGSDNNDLLTVANVGGNIIYSDSLSDFNKNSQPMPRLKYINSFCYDKNNILYVAGIFIDIEYNESFKVVKFNKNSYEDVKSDKSNLNANDKILSLCSDSFGNIYAGGAFKNSECARYVAKWDGNEWSEIGVGSNKLLANGDINTICSDNLGNIYAAGAFTNQNGDYYVAKYSKEINSIPNQEKISSLIIYPNPSQDQITVSSSLKIDSYQIFNLLGEKVLSGSLANPTIRIESLHSGSYLLVLEDKSSNQAYYKKFIK